MEIHCIKSKIIWIVIFYTLLSVLLIGYYSLSNAYENNFKMYNTYKIYKIANSTLDINATTYSNI